MGNSQVLSPPTHNSKFTKYQTSHQFIYIHVPITSKSNQLTPWLALKQHRKHIYSHQFQFSTEHHKNIEDGICSEACTAIFRSLRCTDNLFDQIQRRKLIGRYYQHEQIWYMLNSIVTYALNVHEKGWKWIIGNIHPKNIFIDENGQVRIITINSLPFQKDHYQTYRSEGVLSSYVSPQLIGFTFSKDKNYANFPDCVNKQISQAFTIGMTILSMCILQTNLTSLYDLTFYFNDPREKNKANAQRKNKIYYAHDFGDLLNSKLLNLQIKNISSRYSGLLGTIVKALLNPNPSQRLSLSYLYKQILEPNQCYISSMQASWLGISGLNSIRQEQQDIVSNFSQLQGHLH